MRRRRLLLVALAGACAGWGQAVAESPGPAVGARVPEFELADQSGQSRNLHSLFGPKGLMLVFFRSADWWPYCKGQLVELQQNLDKLHKRGLGVAALSYDSVAVLKHFSERKGITYPLVSDTDSKVIRSYGLLNESVGKNTPQYGIPYPGTFILDKSGVVVEKYFEKDFRQRYTASEILIRQYGDAAGTLGQTIETRHLRLTSSASLGTVHWGQRLALVADIELKPGMHVYAPEVQGYIPIEFGLTATPAFEAHPPGYPVARKLRLKAIGETVPVYQGRFRVAEDITIAPEAQVKPLLSPEGDLTVEGFLRYQACDAKVCYPPQSVPLKWTFDYEALDRQRAPAEMQRQAPNR